MLCRSLVRSATCARPQRATAPALRLLSAIAQRTSFRVPGGEISAERVSEEWASLSVDQWRSVTYCAKGYFAQLSADTEDFVGSVSESLGGDGEGGPLLVEVGCGTGEALLPLAKSRPMPRCRYAVGVDFNTGFIDHCSAAVPAEDRGRIGFLTGDAQELVSLCRDNLPEAWMNRPKVVMCVGNTIQCMPEAVRPKIYQQMKELAGPDGYFIVVYWNGNKFVDGVQHFYLKNPHLYGEFCGGGIDIAARTLTTRSGYHTHWTTPEEAKDIFEKDIGARVVQIKEMGRGVLVVGRTAEA